MQFGIFTIFSVFGIVSNWATKALEDGKVTLDEALDLVTQLCECIGVVPELAIPALTPTELEVSEDTSKALEDTSGDTDLTSEDRAPPGEATAPGAKLDI